MTQSLKALAKRLAYRGGLLSLYHRRRNRDALSVVLFHRVLSRDDPRWASSLPDWTVSDTFFDACLHFFRRHYHVVTLDQVLDATRGGRPLPPRSLLITFDDGYADNAEYALPLLRRHGLPAAVFVYSAAVGSATRPWTEDLAAAHLRGAVTDAQVRALARALDPQVEDHGPETRRWLGALAARWPAVDEGRLRDALASASIELPRPDAPPQMLSADQLRRLVEGGIAIGAHGRTHTALTHAEDLDAELREPRETLARLLGTDASAMATLAFPYGMHDATVVARARELGYELQFLLVPELVPLRDGRPLTWLMPRVNVNERELAPDGVVDAARLALHFFRLPTALPSRASNEH